MQQEEDPPLPGQTIEDATIRGAWYFLCVGVMLQAVVRASDGCSQWGTKSSRKIDKETIYQREAARRWIEGGIGTITFEDCCEALDVDPARAREKIQAHCRSTRGGVP